MFDDEWSGWTDEQLRDYEARLYDDEVDGGDVWYLREQVLDEMRRRGLLKAPK